MLNVDILTLLKFYFHEEFRKTAVSGLSVDLFFMQLVICFQVAILISYLSFFSRAGSLAIFKISNRGSRL